MRRIVLWSLLSALCLLFAREAHAQAKKGKELSFLKETTAQDYAALAKYPGIAGKIVSLGPNAKSVTLRVEYQVPELAGGGGQPKPKNPNPNPGKNPFNKKPNIGGYNPQQLARDLQNIQRIKNPAQKQQRLMQLLNKLQAQEQREQVAQMKWVQQQLQQIAKQQGAGAGQKNPNVKLVTHAKEFQLPIAADVRVAKKMLGLEYDEKGNIKEYTPEQLKKMQDDKLPGYYKSKKEELAPGLTIYVAFTQGADKDKEDPNAKTDISDIIGGTALPAESLNGPLVQTILILSEPGIADTLPQKKKKAK